MNDNQDIRDIAGCITESVGETTSAFDHNFNNKGRWYVVNLEEGSFWNGQGWSMDYKLLTESRITTYGDAKVLSDSVQGAVFREETLIELFDVIAALKALPGNLAAVVRNARKQYKIPYEPNSSGYIEAIKKIADKVDALKEKDRRLSHEEAFDLLVERVMGRGNADITHEVKRAVTQNITGKGIERGRGVSPTRHVRT